MKLISINKLNPAAYNPRTVDRERLDLVKLSLEKLGWVLPVYATSDGEIISGHQRTHVAASLGYTHVPVEILPDIDGNTRKAVNILFNRSTNDMEISTVPAEIKKELLETDPVTLGESIESRMDCFPCMEAKYEPISPLIKINSGKWITYACSIAKSLYRHGVLMPIVTDEDGVVINLIGRLQMLAEKKISTAKVVRLPKEQAVFAKAMLNLLSMDFAIEEKYSDLLRYNSFRRIRRVRHGLGRGFVFAIIGNAPAKNFDITDPKNAARWIAKHGRSVLDFGAGHLTETELLRSVGVRVTPFEPYHIDDKEKIDKQKSIALAREFLADVSSGVQWSSVFISSVLNSVPFRQDREHIVKICAACCGKKSRLYAVASSENQEAWSGIKKQYISRGMLTKMIAGYEENVTLGDIQTAPKAQKYHTPKMFYNLFKTAFKTVNVGYDTGVNVRAICAEPLPLDGLKEALEFEFDLPYPDRSRMGLVKEAIDAFEKRLGVKL